jgi:hypothetical protein
VSVIGPTWQWLKPEIARKKPATFFVQDEYSSTPCFMVIVANLEAACRTEGAVAHRRLLFKAGYAGHRLWMSTLSVGLSRSLFSALIPETARASFDLNSYSRVPLLAFSLGHSI